MAQLKDTIVSGNLRVTDTTLTDTLQVTIIKAPTSSGGTTYGTGTNGQILKSNGTAIYWAADSNTDTKVTSTLLAQSTAAATYLPTFVSAAGNSGVNIMNSFSFGHTVGTTSAVGNSRIILGNATASGTANNEEGQIVLYSSGTSYHTIKGSATSSTVAHSLPTTGGTILNTGTTSFTQTLTSGTKVGSIKINGTSQDIYAPTNTNTTYTLTQDSTDGHKITLTPSSGTAQTITIPDNDTTYSAGSGLSLSGTTFNHSNSVTAVTSAVFKKITYDAQGHITGTSNVVKGDIPALDYVPNTTAGMNAAINLLTTESSNPNLNDYYISQFAAGGTTTTTYHRRPLSALWNTLRSLITIETSGSGNAITSASITNDGNNRKITFSKGSTFSLTDENLLQSNTATSSYRPIVMGTTATTDKTALNTTVTGQGYVSNLMFSKPDIGYLYASAFSTSSYINGTGSQLTQYGLYLKSYGEQNTGTKYSYSRYAVRTYSGKLASDNGMLVEICGGGLTIVGSGESATTLSNLIADDQTVENPERLDVGGTLSTSFQGSSEQLILSSDNNIYFLTKCDTIANRMPVVLDNDSAFYPGTTKTGSIGTSSYYWNTAYIDSLNLSNTSVLSKASGDTYYYVERTDTNVRIGFGVGASGINHGVYSYKFGGWLIYGNATDVLVRANLYNPSTEASLYALPLFGGTPSTGAHALYNNNGFRYSTLEGTTSAVGVARLVLGNNTASGTDGNKRGTIRLYSQSSNYIDLIPASTSSARTITIPAVTATMAVNRKALITDSSSDFASYAWHKFAEVTITSTNYDYVATFLVSSGYDASSTSVPRKMGMLTMHVRTGSTRIFNDGEFEWLFAGDQIDPRNFVMVYTDTASTSCKIELWYKQLYRYEGYTFSVVEEHTRTVKEIYTMTMYDQSGHGSASYTAGTGLLTSKMSKLQTGGYILNNEFNIYTHEIKTDSYKVRNVAVSLNDVEGIMGTDVLCYKAYETNTADDTTLGAYATISTLSDTVTFEGYLARFSYFTLLICIGTDITNRYTIQLTSIDGYQSTQLIWGGAPSQMGGTVYMTSALANITESNGNVTIFIGKCNTYLDFTTATPTFGTTPDIHILKVYGHCIRSNGYH